MYYFTDNKVRRRAGGPSVGHGDEQDVLMSALRQDVAFKPAQEALFCPTTEIRS